MSETEWKQCNICKKEIAFKQPYYVCSVSTCNRKRTGMVFCSMPCFDAHLPMMRHRDAWAEQEHAPTREQAAKELAEDNAESAAAAPVKRRVVGSAAASAPSDDVPIEVLVVASKLKKFIRAKSGMNTSENVMPVVSAHLRWLSVAALRHAAEDGRKTVFDRDFEAVIDKLQQPS